MKSFRRIKESYIFKKKELAYWRKYYDLQELIHEEYDGEVVNCGFHELTDGTIDDIVDFLVDNNESLQDILESGFAAKMYHEWY